MSYENRDPSQSPRLAIPSAAPPEELLHAYLLSTAGGGGPWPATSKLLGHTPTLQRLEIEPGSNGLPVGVPGFGDLVLVLTTPQGGVIHALVTGPLARGLVGLLLDEEPALPTPLSAAEAGLLTGLAATTLRDLEPEPRSVESTSPEPRPAESTSPEPSLLGIQDVAVIRDNNGLPHDQHRLPDDPALCCNLTVDCGSASGRLVLLLNTAAARSLRGAVKRWRPPPSDRGGELPLTAHLMVARTELFWSRLTDLEPGDAIVFPSPAPPDDHWPIHLAVANLLFPATLRHTEGGREVEIRGFPMDPTDSSAPSDPSISSDPGDPSDPSDQSLEGPARGDLLDRLPVTLTAILGRVELTAGAVARLAPGAVISLDQPVGDTIQLRAGSRSIGKGELVEVDGSLGVRLTEITL